jgi:S1-C subfamily serine protease
MNLRDISTQLLFSTAPLWVQRASGEQAFGTAFILSLPVPASTDQQMPFLVTNAHVVADAQRAIVDLVEREGDAPKRGGRLRVEIEGATVTAFTDAPNDLAIVPIGGLLNELEQGGRPVFFRSVSADLIPTEQALSDLAAMEEVTFIGYPSGLYDEHNLSPIIRRGITATPAWNDFQGQRAFLIDAGVFPGSSGSPVFILNQGAYPTPGGLVVGHRLLFMGVLTEAILRTEQDLPPVFLGLGKVIKASRLRDFTEHVREQLLSGQMNA